MPWSIAAIAAFASSGCDDETPPLCFVPDTLVYTPSGHVPIGSLKPGDEIYAYAHDEGRLVSRRVTHVLRKKSMTICRIITSAGALRGVTPSHPFFDATRSAYLPLRDLGVGARLQSIDGGRLALEEIDIQEAPEPLFEVVNLTVEGPEHNYFADGILVHNKQCDECVCGDGFVESGNSEECDDGNTLDGDGCSAACQLEGGGGGGAGGDGGETAGGGGAGGDGGETAGGGGAGGDGGETAGGGGGGGSGG